MHSYSIGYILCFKKLERSNSFVAEESPVAAVKAPAEESPVAAAKAPVAEESPVAAVKAPVAAAKAPVKDKNKARPLHWLDIHADQQRTKSKPKHRSTSGHAKTKKKRKTAFRYWQDVNPTGTHEQFKALPLHKRQRYNNLEKLGELPKGVDSFFTTKK